MDTSEKYIKMCAAAEEIQAMRAPNKRREILGGYELSYAFESGDWIAYYEDSKWGIAVKGDTIYDPSIYHRDDPPTWVKKIEIDFPFVGCDEGNFATQNIEKIIWLPRLDQLIEIDMQGIDFVAGIKKILLSHLDEFEANNVTIEQMWLELVMKEIFHKTWNGEKWS